ncbi:Uncharacterized protein ChrSV_0750 [Chromobacterium vaccinii]|nr:hypothetical protein [Chromobacterium vaccinii]QND82978.1 Uncharacterized protein ChrSW_0750 [Chromobacterium vaccinii]QND88209.1 Uncharacterized protein ChrSV_0750 [Chromobacterium vaccinii]
MAGHALPSPINAAVAISQTPIARAIPDGDALRFHFSAPTHRHADFL